MLAEQLKKIARVKNSTRGCLFIEARDKSNEDHWAAIELLLETIYPENWDGSFGTYYTKERV